MMLWLITTTPKDVDFGHIAAKIPNATPKAIMERMSKLVRERKAIDAADGYTPVNKSTTPDGKVTLATHRAAAKAKAGKSAKGSGKRKRVEEEGDGESDDGVELKSVEKMEEENEVSAAANDEGDKKKPAEFPMPTSARAKAISKKLKLAAEKNKTEVKKEIAEGADVAAPVRGAKSKKNAKENTEDKQVVHASVEDDADEENAYEGYEVVG
ncbi:ubiquitin fusion degradation protein 1 [Physcia stellaris]|nr:ubiquitin fusion degradation protein 1 [Physcia stellaris]